MADDYKRFTGEVSILTLKNGKKIARANYRSPDTGKRKQISVTVKGERRQDEKTAEAKVRDRIEKILNKKPESKDAKTFNDLADYFEAHRAVPAVFVEGVKVAGMKTHKNVRHDIKILREFFGKMLLSEITRDSIIKFRLEELKKPVRRIKIVNGEKQVYFKQKSLASVHHLIRTLGNAFACAMEIGWIDRAPSFKGLAQRSIENKRERIPTETEFARLLHETRQSQQPVLTAFVLMIADCGGRPTELYNLRFADLDFEANTVTFTSDKGKRRTRRTIGLTERLRAELERLPRRNEFVFGGIKSVKNSWNKARRRAGFEYDLYTLRRFYISRLDRNPNLSQVAKMRLSGHQNIQMQDNYITLSDEILKESARFLSDTIQDLGEV